MLIVELHGPSIPVRTLEPVETILFRGQPNRLSEEQVAYPLIERIHAATKLTAQTTIPVSRPGEAIRARGNQPVA